MSGKSKEEIEEIKNNYNEKKREIKAREKMEAAERRKMVEETKQVIASTRAERMKQREDGYEARSKRYGNISVGQIRGAPLQNTALCWAA